MAEGCIAAAFARGWDMQARWRARVSSNRDDSCGEELILFGFLSALFMTGLAGCYPLFYVGPALVRVDMWVDVTSQPDYGPTPWAA